jgi:hypothetical protein
MEEFIEWAKAYFGDIGWENVGGSFDDKSEVFARDDLLDVWLAGRNLKK